MGNDVLHNNLKGQPALLSTKKRDVLKIEKEAVIRTLKLKLVTKLADMIGEHQALWDVVSV
jgi:hypothetical protein